MCHHILTRKLCVVLRKSPLKTYAAVHVTSNSHLQAVCSAEKESFKKLMLAVHVTSHSHLQLCVVMKKSPLKNLCCSTCDITFSLPDCVWCLERVL